MTSTTSTTSTTKPETTTERRRWTYDVVVLVAVAAAAVAVMATAWVPAAGSPHATGNAILPLTQPKLHYHHHHHQQQQQQQPQYRQQKQPQHILALHSNVTGERVKAVYDHLVHTLGCTVTHHYHTVFQGFAVVGQDEVDEEEEVVTTTGMDMDMDLMNMDDMKMLPSFSRNSSTSRITVTGGGQRRQRCDLPSIQVSVRAADELLFVETSHPWRHDVRGAIGGGGASGGVVTGGGYRAQQVQELTESTDLSWGLDRLDQLLRPSVGPALDHRYRFTRTGKGVHLYVVDSGVDGTHPEFRVGVSGGGGMFSRVVDAFTVPSVIGRLAASGVTGATGGRADEDCADHGTHVAGLAAGLNTGVAKEATVHSVRVMGCDKTTTTVDLVQAMDWILRNHQKPAIINLSVGSELSVIGGGGGGGSSSSSSTQPQQFFPPRSLALDRAIQAARDAGIFVVAAAGNDGRDPCATSPAGSPGAYTVGATDQRDHRSPFSNHGPCVQMFAPGTDLVSARSQSAGAGAGAGSFSQSSMQSSSPSSTNTPQLYRVQRGTSMSAPLVAGVAALFLEENPQATPDQVVEALHRVALVGAVRDARGSANRLLQSLYVPAQGSKEADQRIVALSPKDSIQGKFEWSIRLSSHPPTLSLLPPPLPPPSPYPQPTRSPRLWRRQAADRGPVDRRGRGWRGRRGRHTRRELLGGQACPP